MIYFIALAIILIVIKGLVPRKLDAPKETAFYANRRDMATEICDFIVSRRLVCRPALSSCSCFSPEFSKLGEDTMAYGFCKGYTLFDKDNPHEDLVLFCQWINDLGLKFLIKELDENEYTELPSRFVYSGNSVLHWKRRRLHYPRYSLSPAECDKLSEQFIIFLVGLESRDKDYKYPYWRLNAHCDSLSNFVGAIFQSGCKYVLTSEEGEVVFDSSKMVAALLTDGCHSNDKFYDNFATWFGST